jgi:hypothetical protein
MMERLADTVLALQSDISTGSLERAGQLARAALRDGNPWTRSIARGLALVVELGRADELAAARELLEDELARSLPDRVGM